MYKAIIAIGIAVVAGLIAGCGSSSDETAEAVVTKTQFIKQAGEICSKTRDEAGKAAAAWEKANGKRLNFDSAFREIIGPALQQEAEELRSLTAPNGDEAKLKRMIENLSNGASELAADGSSSRSSRNIRAFQRETKAYGLDSCGI